MRRRLVLGICAGLVLVFVGVIAYQHAPIATIVLPQGSPLPTAESSLQQSLPPSRLPAPLIRPANLSWRVSNTLEGEHPGVPLVEQRAIAHCGKEELPDTPENRAKGVVWLTFDDSASNTQVETILSILEQHKVRGWFFLIDNWARNDEHRALVERIRTRGHVVGNHSATHTALFRIKKRDGGGWLIADQPQSLVEKELQGGSNAAWMRFPYGAYDDRTLAILANLPGADGKPMQPCGWTVDSLDWNEAETPTAKVQLERIQANMTPNAVVLMHLFGRFTPAVLPQLIRWLHDQGYRTEPLQAPR